MKIICIVTSAALVMSALLILSSCAPPTPALPFAPTETRMPPTKTPTITSIPIVPTIVPTIASTPTIAPDEIVQIRVGDVNPDDPLVKPLLGVISGPDPSYTSKAINLTTHYQDIGVTSIRNNDYYDDRLDMEGIFNCGGSTYPSWDGCDPNDDQFYNWGSSDKQFQSYLDGGFEPFFRVGGEWDNTPRSHDFKGPQNSTQEKNWITAAVKVVDHYINWPSQPNAFTYLDIWTEFPGTQFWDRPNPEFFPFWAQAYTRLKAAYSSLKVGGPGFSSPSIEALAGGSRNNPIELFLTYLYKNKVKSDWIGCHIFHDDPLVYWQGIQACEDVLRGTSQFANVPWAGTGYFDDVELIIDAYGFGFARPELTDEQRYQMGGKMEGASILTSAWIAMQYQDIERAYYYRGDDMFSDPNALPGGNSHSSPGQGLFFGDAQGTYKPSAHVFRLWSIIVNKYSNLLTTELPVQNSQMPLWVLAAQNDSGQRAILIANPTTQNIGWTVSFASGPVGLKDYGDVEIYQVNDQQDGRTPSVWNGGVVTIPSGCVQLVLLAQ